jgi:hypothetical protein
MGVLAVPPASAAEIPTVTPEKEGFSTERLARLDAKMHGYVDQGSTAGIITLIARHGRIVHFDVYGKAGIAAGTPIKANSLFRVYSMTKPITSTALLMLYEEGKFQLDDPLEKFFPEFKDLQVYVAGSGDQMKAGLGCSRIWLSTPSECWTMPVERTEMLCNSILLNAADDVATAIVELQKGDIGRFANSGEIIEIPIRTLIPRFHKFAIHDLHKSKLIRKYGEVIGQMTEDAVVGSHIHDHNLVSPARTRRENERL